jgi:peptide-methionine (S)-S-oxide reductase
VSSNGATSNGESPREVAYLASGCFWCTEAVFQDLRGVYEAQSGYMGGHTFSPTYDQICSGRTGHAEMVRVTFDPNEISFRDLLEVFFAVHDPTTLNRQGADVGTQYRSAIFFANQAQERSAREVIAELTTVGAFPSPIVTEVTAAGQFYRAEPVHDEYFLRNPGAGYCRVIIGPKVAKFRKQFAGRLQAESAGAGQPSAR